MSDKRLRWILAFLWLDLIVSLLWLAYAARQNGGQATDAQTATSPVVLSTEPATPSAPPAPSSPVPAQQETTQVKQQVATAQRQVTQEVAQQTETFSQLTGNEHEQWVTLKELEAISPQAYQDCVRWLESQREQAAEHLEARQQFLAEWQSDILSEEENAEVMQALEFLNLCDRNTAAGTPIPDRSADFDNKRIERLRQPLEKYCCAISGLSGADLEKQELGERLASPSENAYIFIVPSNLDQRIFELQ